MRPRLLCAAAMLALAGCNGSDSPGGNMTAEQVAGELSEMKITPGQWEATNEILSASAPGMPEDMLAAMVGRKISIQNCITPEQAAKPNANFLAAQENNDCTYQDWSMAGGRMRGTMSCKGGDTPGAVVMKMDGTYGAESYDLVMDMETGGLPDGATMTIKARTTGKRVGDCT